LRSADTGPLAGSVLVSVPEGILLSAHTISNDETFQDAVHRIPIKPKERALLSALLLREASLGKSSAWAPYLRILPTDYTILGAFPEDVEDDFQARHAL
jgi:hypothetical protein